MLRFLALLSLRVAACFLLLGVLIARAWGWSEDASPELYVIYYQMQGQGFRFFAVNADGSGVGETLAYGDVPISKVDCSPDGRVFAFLSDDGALYSLTPEGISARGAADRAYNTLNVADDGTIALFDPAAGWLDVNRSGVQLFDPDEPNHPMDRIDISPRGLVLWARHFTNIQVLAPSTGEVVAALPRGYSASWLAAGEIFTFYDVTADAVNGLVTNGGQYVMDMRLRKAVRLDGWTMTRPLSPDGTKVAAALTLGRGYPLVQVVVYDLFTDANRRQLTFDTSIASQPLCFLSFRPQPLIVG